MKNLFTLSTLTMAALWLCVGALHAQVPNLVSYQGRVVVGSTNFTGSGQFKFALVDTTGANTYWSNDGTSTVGSQPTAAVTLAVSGGVYSVLLGDTTLTNMTAVPTGAFGNPDVRLRVWFSDGSHGFQLLTPDQRLSPNGYLPDGSITTTKIAIGAVTGPQLASNLTLGGITTGAFAGDGSQLSGLSSGGGSSYNLNKVALLKWGATTTDNTFTAGAQPIGVCFDGAHIWVANASSNNVTELNAATGAVMGTFAAGTTPYALCFDGSSVWVSDLSVNRVTKINAATGATIGTYNVGSGTTAMCFDGSSIWLGNNDNSSVTNLNAATGAIIGTYLVQDQSSYLCFDGANIWVSNNAGSTVTELNPATGAVEGTFTVGNNPYGICFDGANIWVAIESNATVQKLNGATGAVMATYAVGANPTGICYDGSNLWVESSSGLQEVNGRTGAVMATYFLPTITGFLCFDGANIWASNNINAVIKF